MKKKQASHRWLSAVLFFYWAGTTVMVGFMVMFLKESGYSDTESGLVASWVAAGTLLLQPSMGHLSDTCIPARRLLMACLAAALPLAALLPMLGRGLLLSAGVVALSLLCEPQATLIDNYIIRLKEQTPDVDYGRVRAWGPMGSAFAAVAAGVLGWIWPLRLMFLLVAAFFGACLIFLLRCGEVGCPASRAQGGGGAGFFGTLKGLAHIPAYLLFIGCCCLFQFAMRTATTFLGLVVMEQGGGSMELGILLVVVYAGQMPFMLWAGRRLKAGMGCGSLFLLAILLSGVRLLLFCLPLPFWATACTQVLQAAGTGLFTRVFVQHITDITPPETHATATSAGAALSLGMGQIVGGVIHGRLIESAGAGASALLSAGVMAVTFVLFWALSRMLPRPTKNGPVCG